jgi:hypothetical protein
MNRNLLYLYRCLFSRGGYGVHSPFAYELLLNVVEERTPYYYYVYLSTLRRMLLSSDKLVEFGGVSYSVRRLFRRVGMSRSESEFFFRISHRCKPRVILSIGSSCGLIPLSLTGYSAGISCVILEESASLSTFVQDFLTDRTAASLQILSGLYDVTLPHALSELPRIDCLVLDRHRDAEYRYAILYRILPSLHTGSICLIRGIRSSVLEYRLWSRLCEWEGTAELGITLTLDLCDVGVLFFDVSLRRRTYRSVLVPSDLDL